MTSVTVRLTDAQADHLASEAQKLGVSPEDLVRAAILDLIEGRDETFLAAARNIIEKNSELYKQLA
jgi:predicted transcriptional regulator